MAANGCGTGRGTHLAVFAPIVRGVHDNTLKWPFIGRVHFTLLNQLEDRNHHVRTLNLDATRKAGVSNSTWGLSSFIPNTMLAHDPIRNIQYLKDDTLHFKMSAELADPCLECREMCNTLGKLQSTVLHLQQQNASLRGVSTPFPVTVSDYQRKKDTNEVYTSPSFYTCPNGYCMALRVHANGDTTGKGTHVSVRIAILYGKYDAEIKWPFGNLKVIVTLKNQLKDKNHFIKILPTTAVASKGGGSDYDSPTFIRNSELLHNPDMNTQYLKDDMLHFAVRVETADGKNLQRSQATPADIQTLQTML